MNRALLKYLAIFGLMALAVTTAGADLFHNHTFCGGCEETTPAGVGHECPVHIFQLGAGSAQITTFTATLPQPAPVYRQESGNRQNVAEIELSPASPRAPPSCI